MIDLSSEKYSGSTGHRIIICPLTYHSPLSELCPSKKLTIHSPRKTVVKKLQSSGVQKNEIRVKSSRGDGGTVSVSVAFCLGFLVGAGDMASGGCMTGSRLG